MKDIYENRQWHSSDVNKLESSTIHSYLNSTFLNLFDSNIKDAIKQVKIPYRKNGGSGGTNQSGANGLSCKIFLLSGYEVGWTSSDNQYFPQDGARLSYFESGTGTSANNKRIAKLNGSTARWWLRSPGTNNTNVVWYVYSNGNYGSSRASYSTGIRPALILPSTYELDLPYDLTVTIPKKIKTGDILNCPYSGSAKSITLPKGQYKLECWGAQGGYRSSSSYGGNGGYSVGILNLAQKTTVYLYAGGAGNTGGTAGGFNGGGSRSSYNGGGGGTDIRIGSNSLYARVIVAGGGGSDGATRKIGMYGGGTSGGTTTESYGSGGGGGTQTAGGTGGSNNAGTFGQGGQGLSRSSGYGGAGGGGWYGGGGSYPDGSDDDDRGGGGGSGYVYTSSTASNYPSGCLLNSSYYLTDAQTIAGNTAFTSPTGTNETGHTGNGYIRITVIEASSGNTLVKTTSNTWKEQKQMFINTGGSTTISSGLIELEYIKPNSTQYINTQFIPTGNTRIIFTFEPTVADNQALYTGGRTEASGKDPKTFSAFYISKAIRRDYYGTSKTTTTTYDINTKITVDANKNTTLINSSSALTDFTLNTSTTSIMPIILFIAANQSSSSSAIQVSGSGAQYKFYSCKIYDNNTLVRDFVPAKRISDGKCGLWDKVNFKFYTDENGGNFTAGAEKTAIAAIGTSIEYLEATGTQYLDTGITVNKNDNKELIMSCQLSDDDSYAGANGYMQYQASITEGAKGILKISYKNNIETIYFNDVLKLTKDWTSAYSGTNVKLGIFKLGETNNTWYNSSAWQIGKLYYYKLYDNGTLIRDFIPVKRISDNEYGLWDKVTKTFYPNAGTGTFTAGPAITLSGWHKIKGIWAKTTADTWSQAL